MEDIDLKGPWCYAAYCTLNDQDQSKFLKWYKMKPRQWVFARHLIESFGIEELQKNDLGQKRLPLDGKPYYNDYLRAFVGFASNTLNDFQEKAKIIHFKSEIKSQDFLNKCMFIYLVRTPMPIGGKPYVPLESKSMYVLTNAQYEETKDDASLKKLQAFNERNEKASHASDLETKILKIENEILVHNHTLKTVSEVSYLVPEETYMCTNCGEFGHHYKEACYLWPKKASKGFVFGAKKLGPSIQTTVDDSKKLSLMYNRFKKK